PLTRRRNEPASLRNMKRDSQTRTLPPAGATSMTSSGHRKPGHGSLPACRPWRRNGTRTRARSMGTFRSEDAPSLRKDGAGESSPPTRFRRVLIANRGEIAVGIIRACRDLGLQTVAVYSDADARATHVRLADAAVRLGPPPPTESYLRLDAIVDAARATNADAVHPGYGFLAERASFARAVRDAGLVFVGPEPDAIEALGDKLHARLLAREAGVPIVPGTIEPATIDRPDQLGPVVDAARAVGFPLLV